MGVVVGSGGAVFPLRRAANFSRSCSVSVFAELGGVLCFVGGWDKGSHQLLAGTKLVSRLQCLH